MKPAEEAEKECLEIGGDPEEYNAEPRVEIPSESTERSKEAMLLKDQIQSNPKRAQGL